LGVFNYPPTFTHPHSGIAGAFVVACKHYKPAKPYASFRASLLRNSQDQDQPVAQ
jgi:hypothetical protein